MNIALLFSTIVMILTGTYRFEQTVAGYRPSHQEGRVVVDGTKWRIEMPEIDFNTLIGEFDHAAAAVNDANHTWFPFTSPARLAIGGPLFAMPYPATVSNVRVSYVDATQSRVSFSYDLECRVSGEKVRGRVWGEIRVWTGDIGVTLPWAPAAVATGFDEVDRALRARLPQGGAAWKSVTDVSRRIENGETLRQTITRTISDPEPVKPGADDFKVPAGYRQQAPVIGAPGP